MKHLKRSFRLRTQEIRKKIHQSHRQEKDAAIQAKLEELPVFQKATSILLYYNIEDEVKTESLIEKYLYKKDLLLPRVEAGNTLRLHHIKSIRHVEKNKFGILEPILKSPVVEPSTVQLAIIPGIAFDLQKNRLGFGGGFYDRLIPKLNCPKIALAYDCQIIEDIPIEAHDQPVDLIITETRIIN